MRRLLVLVVVLVTTASACGGSRDETTVTVADGLPGATPEWERLPNPPLSPRLNTVMVWTGSEIVVVGGDRFDCPPAASCIAPAEPPLADGAAYEMETGVWRPIADAPVGFHSASGSAYVDGSVYISARTDYQGGTLILRYDLEADRWDELSPPPGDPSERQFVVAGDRLVAYASSEEGRTVGDHWLDPVALEWRALSPDPMSDGFDRTQVWADPYLYLLDHEIVPTPSGAGPSVVRAARLNFETMTWERLPDSEILAGWAPWIAEGQLITNPSIGSSDGGQSNGWGESYAWGGSLDGQTTTWVPLPPGAPEPDRPGMIVPVAGGFGTRSGAYGQPVGQVLDIEHGHWLTMAHPTEPDQTRATQMQSLVIAAGRDAVAFEAGAVWLWRAPPRS